MLLIILFIIFFILIFIFICFCGENGCNKICKNANECPLSVRCNAKNKKDIKCFERKVKFYESFKNKR